VESCRGDVINVELRVILKARLVSANVAVTVDGGDQLAGVSVHVSINGGPNHAHVECEED